MLHFIGKGAFPGFNGEARLAELRAKNAAVP